LGLTGWDLVIIGKSSSRSPSSDDPVAGFIEKLKFFNILELKIIGSLSI